MKAEDTVMENVTPVALLQNQRELWGLLREQAEISFPAGEKSVAKAVLAIIENPKQLNYRLKEIAEYCEAKVGTGSD